MLRNYLKMALKVLLRKKFYTFISMFGISVTLAILLVVYAFFDHALGAHKSEKKVGSSLMVTRLTTSNHNGRSTSSGMPSYSFLDRYVRSLKTPEKVSLHSNFNNVSTYVDGRKIDLALKYTDAEFWEVTTFNFIEGRPYHLEEVEKKQRVVVLNREVKEKIFGHESALGKEIDLYKEKFRVIGVVENVPLTRPYSYGAVFMPVSHDKSAKENTWLRGDYTATILAGHPSQRIEVQREFEAMMQQVENPDPKRIENIYVYADSYFVTFSRPMLGNDLEGNDGQVYLFLVITILIFLFMLIPTVNLMNLNISRVLERSSEIGIRKAFGGSSGALIMQFLLENLVLTLIGGLISVGIAFGLLEAINASDLIPHADLNINYNVVGAAVFITFFFGILSGVYPALRMSRLQAAVVLKAG